MSEHHELAVTNQQLMTLAHQQETQIIELQQVVSAMGAMLDMLETRLRHMERSRVTISARQAKALMARIKARALWLCAKYAIDESDAGKFRDAIRKDVLRQYGIEDIHDLPLAYMELAGSLIDEWTSYKLVQRIRARRER